MVAVIEFPRFASVDRQKITMMCGIFRDKRTDEGRGEIDPASDSLLRKTVLHSYYRIIFENYWLE